MLKKLLRWSVLWAVLVTVEIAAAALGWWLRGPASLPASSHPNPTVEQIRQLSTLVTTRIEVADVQETTVRGRTGGMRVALLVKGDLLLGVNLAEARFEQIDRGKQTAVLWLPQPRVTSPRVDHRHTRLVQVQNDGLWLVVPVDAGRSRVIEAAYAQAQAAVEKAGADPELIETSRHRAQQVITSFFQALGWSVQVHWAEAH